MRANLISLQRPFSAILRSHTRHHSFHHNAFRLFAVGAKRAHDDEEEVIDLAAADDEEDHEHQRRKIMEFAQNARRNQSNDASGSQLIGQNAQNPSSSPKNGGSGDVEEFDLTKDEEEAARNRIMAHAAAVNAEKNTQSTNSLLAQLHAERMARRATRHSPPPTADAKAARPPQKQQQGGANSPSPPPRLSILSYNVWFREDMAMDVRLNAISSLISQHNPDCICLQEITPYIYSYFEEYAQWWNKYEIRPFMYETRSLGYFTTLLWRNSLVTRGGDGGYACLPYDNSIMGRDLKSVNVATSSGLGLRVATSHLESPLGRGKLNSQPRKVQCQMALDLLDGLPGDTVFVGDMNWTEKNDGPVPLPPQWIDAWVVKHPNDPGYTYDARNNAMLRRGPWGLQLRLDRAFMRINDWQLESIEMIGKEAIPGEWLDDGKPVLPSDHYGLVIKLQGRKK